MADLDNMSDEELLALYKQMKASAPTPYQPKKKPTLTYNKVQMAQGDAYDQPYTQEEYAAAKQGVNIDSGVPDAGMYAKGSLAFDKNRRDAYFVNEIRKKYPSAALRLNPNSQELEWINPDDPAKQWTRVQSSQTHSMLSNVGEVIPAVGEIGGAIAGVAASARMDAPFTMPVTVPLGAGAGRAIGEYAKSKVGDAFGVNPDVAEKDKFKNAGAKGVESFLFNMAGDAAMAAPFAVKYWLRGGKAFTPTEAADIAAQAGKYDYVQTEINQKTSGGFNPSAAQKASVDPNRSGYSDIALAHQENLQAFPPTQKREAVRLSNNMKAINEYWDNQILNARMGDPVSLHNGGLAVKDMIRRLKEGSVTDIERQALEANSALVQRLEAMGNAGVNIDEAGIPILEQVRNITNQLKSHSDIAYADYRELAGFNEDTVTSAIKVPVTPELRKLMNRMDAKERTALFNIQRNPQTRYKIDLPEGTPDRNSTILGADGTPLVVKGDEAAFDLHQIDDAVQYLREEQRARGGSSDIALADLPRMRVLNELVDMRNNYLAAKYPEVFDKLRFAENEYKRYRTDLDNTVTNQLVARNERNEYVLNAADTPETLWKNRSVADAEKVSHYFTSNPTALNEFKQWAFAKYRAQYAPKGKITPQEHKRFIDNEYKVLKPFLNAQEQKTIEQDVMGMAKVAADSQVAYRKAVERWNKSFPSLANKWNQEGFVQAFFTKSGSDRGMGLENMKNLSNLIRNEAGVEAHEKWKNAILTEFDKKSRGPDGNLNPDQLGKLISSNKEKLEAVFGKQWTANLDIANTGLRMITNKSKSSVPLPAKSNAFSAIARIPLGVISKEGRAMSAGFTLRGRAYFAKMEEALYSPEKMNELVNSMKKDKELWTSITVGMAGYNGLKSFDD